MLDTLLHDLRTSARALKRRPGLTTTIVVTLALGIGANGVILALLHAAYIQPIALFTEPERIVDVLPIHQERNTRLSFWPADFIAFRNEAQSFDHFAAFDPLGSTNLTGDGLPQRLAVHFVTADFFPALGIEPLFGRLFDDADEHPGNDRVTLLSRHLWRQRFGSVNDIVGRTILLDDEPHTVIGVLPGGFGVAGGFPDLWLPLAFGPERPIDRQSGTLGGIARLHRGVSLATARQEMDVLARRLEETFPATNRGMRLSLEPRIERMRAGSEPLLVLLGAVALVLLIAVVNVANLGLVRVFARRRELMIRASLGAGRWQLLRLIVCENLLLALAGGVLSLLAIYWGLGTLPELRGIYLYRSVELSLNGWVVALVLGLSLLTGLLTAVLPGRIARRTSALDGGEQISSPAVGSRSSRRVGRVLAISQVALSFVLLFGAGLLIRSLSHLLDTELGLRTANVLTFKLTPPVARYPDAAALGTFESTLLATLESLPGVRSVALSDGAPGDGWMVAVHRAGESPDSALRCRSRLVSPGYFTTVGIELLRGRTIRPQDSHGAPKVLLLSQRAARLLFGADDPLGQRVAWDDPEDWHEVVGIVADVRRNPLEDPRPAAYVVHAQHATLLDTIRVRDRMLLFASELPQTQLVPAVQQVVAQLDPSLPIFAFKPLAETVRQAILKPRLHASLFGSFAFLALVLTAVGLYGLLSYGARQRRQEIAVRMAFGARPRDVWRAFLAQGLAWVAIGLAAGALGAFLLRSVLGSLLYGVTVDDTITWLVVGIILLIVTVLATAIPARRAARLDPNTVLRGE